MATQPQPSDYGYNPDGGLSSANVAAGKKYKAALKAYNSPTPSTPASPTPTAPPQDTSQHTVWKDGKSTIVLGHEVASYLAQGYTSNQAIPEVPPIETPTEISTEVLDTPITTEDIQAQVSSPIENIQQVFGQEWTPAPIFEQLGLIEQGVVGAVRIKGMDDVYTIGEGGRKETAESYLERFGTAEQAGIVGEISMEEAIKLGIVVGSESIVEPLKPFDPYEVWADFRDEDKAEIDDMRKTLKDATLALIEQLKDYGEDKAEAKDEEKEKLGIDEKDKAITEAEKTYADAMQVYSEVLLKNRSTSGAMSRILGTESRITAQRAIELAPLATNILIAQKSYARAKDLLDDWSTDYAEAMQFQMQAAQMNINMLEGELNREQAENLAEAQIKFDIWRDTENRRLDTQEEVKKLMLMYPEAGVSIADNWEDAYKKIGPYVQDEADFEKKMRDIELATAQKKLTGGTVGEGTKGETDIGTYALAYKNGEISLTGIPIAMRAEAKRLADDLVMVQGQWIYKPTGEQVGQAMLEEEGLSDEDFYQQTKDIFVEYKDKGFSKEEIKTSFGKDFSLDHQAVLDEVFGSERTFWQWLIPGGK